MLEGLNQIDWSKLRHAYGSAVDTPDYLRMLLLPTSKTGRTSAHEHLESAVNHQGDVMSATAAVVPFLIELVDNEETPNRVWILRYLVSLLDACNALPNAHYLATPMMGVLKDEIDTYHNIRSGLDTFIKLLTYSDDRIRKETAWIIGNLYDCREQSLDPLWRALGYEHNSAVQMAQIESIGNLFTYTYPGEMPDREKVMQYLDALALRDPELDVRVRAAMTLTRMAVDGYQRPAIIPPHIRSILVDALADHAINTTGTFTVFSEALVECVSLTGIPGMVTMLRLGNLKSPSAHVIARELLDKVFQRQGPTVHWGHFQRWYVYEDQYDESSKDRYQLPQHHMQYTGDILRHHDQRKAVEAIVDCDPFWEHPTNLLSFFYGLPDDREELRALLVED